MADRKDGRALATAYFQIARSSAENAQVDHQRLDARVLERQQQADDETPCLRDLARARLRDSADCGRDVSNPEEHLSSRPADFTGLRDQRLALGDGQHPPQPRKCRRRNSSPLAMVSLSGCVFSALYAMIWPTFHHPTNELCELCSSDPLEGSLGVILGRPRAREAIRERCPGLLDKVCKRKQ